MSISVEGYIGMLELYMIIWIRVYTGINERQIKVRIAMSVCLVSYVELPM